MRIVGCAFSGLPGPVTEGSIGLGDVTALLGPNDAGKSRLLDAFVAAVAGAAAPSSRYEVVPSAAVYAELDDQEFEWVTSRGWASMSKEAQAVTDFV